MQNNKDDLVLSELYPDGESLRRGESMMPANLKTSSGNEREITTEFKVAKLPRVDLTLTGIKNVIIK